jgi:hypothetical protein
MINVKFIKHWKRGIKIDSERELPDGVANLLIKRRFAVAVEPESTVVTLKREAPDANPFSEAVQATVTGQRRRLSIERGDEAPVARSGRKGRAGGGGGQACD